MAFVNLLNSSVTQHTTGFDVMRSLQPMVEKAGTNSTYALSVTDCTQHHPHRVQQYAYKNAHKSYRNTEFSYASALYAKHDIMTLHTVPTRSASTAVRVFKHICIRSGFENMVLLYTSTVVRSTLVLL